jgi:hypothetical protein
VVKLLAGKHDYVKNVGPGKRRPSRCGSDEAYDIRLGSVWQRGRQLSLSLPHANGRSERGWRVAADSADAYPLADKRSAQLIIRA